MSEFYKIKLAVLVDGLVAECTITLVVKKKKKRVGVRSYRLDV